MQIQGQAAIVTGGASGPGASTVKALADRGMKVYAFDLAQSIDKAEPIKNVEYLEVNVTDQDSIRMAMTKVSEGAEPLRVVINRAGIATPGRILSRSGITTLTNLRTLSMSTWWGHLMLTLGAELIAKQEPVDEDGQRGIVINTASVAAFEGQLAKQPMRLQKVGCTRLPSRQLGTWPPTASVSTPSLLALWKLR